jgi:hypothetical protein
MNKMNQWNKSLHCGSPDKGHVEGVSIITFRSLFPFLLFLPFFKTPACVGYLMNYQGWL